MSPAHLSLATSSETATGSDCASLLDRVRSVGREVIAPASVAVDRDARFPEEAMAALRELRLLSAYVPTQYGGMAASAVERLLTTRSSREPARNA